MRYDSDTYFSERRDGDIEFVVDKRLVRQVATATSQVTSRQPEGFISYTDNLFCCLLKKLSSYL